MSEGNERDLTFFLLYILGTATLGPLLFGYHLAELNAPQDVITCAVKTYTAQSYPPPLPSCIPMSTLEYSIISSAFTVGGLLGALLAGPIASKYGRLLTMRLTTLAFILGPISEACAASVPILASGRGVSGIGAGASIVVVPLYISEIAPPGRKGTFGAFTQIMVNVGILIAQVLGLFLSRGQLWRIILGVAGVIGLIQATGLALAVESPRWSADHGQTRQAKTTLQQIRGEGVDIDKEVESWSAEPRKSQSEEEDALLDDQPHTSLISDPSNIRKEVGKQSVGFFTALFHPEYYRATVAVMVIMVAQQFCGINSIVMYGVSVLSVLLAQSAAIINVFVALVNLVVTIACAPLADKLGRKPCLLLSIAGMGSSSLLFGVAVLLHVPILAAITVVTFVGSFGVGLGPVPFILSSELVGPEAVGATQSWALAANWTSTFVIAQFFPVLNEALGKGKVYFIFAGLAVGFFAFVALRVPETKGKRNADEVWGRSARPD